MNSRLRDLKDKTMSRILLWKMINVNQNSQQKLQSTFSTTKGRKNETSIRETKVLYKYYKNKIRR